MRFVSIMLQILTHVHSYTKCKTTGSTWDDHMELIGTTSWLFFLCLINAPTLTLNFAKYKNNVKLKNLTKPLSLLPSTLHSGRPQSPGNDCARSVGSSHGQGHRDVSPHRYVDQRYFQKGHLATSFESGVVFHCYFCFRN